MATEETTNLNWDKPIFPSDNLASEFDTLFSQIDEDVASLGGSWTVSDNGTEILSSPADLNFKNLLSATDDGNGGVDLDVDSIDVADLSFDPATQSELDTHAGNSSAHHSKYTDSDAIGAINNDTDHGSTASHNYFSGSHSDLSNVGAADHHSKYTDSEARSAVESGNLSKATFSTFEIVENSSTNSLDFNYTG